MFFAARVASGCSAATAQKVTPMMVSARVVNTHSLSALPSSSYGKAKRTPVLLPIQFFCISRTCSGQPWRVVELGQQFLGVGGDLHVVHGDLALFHERRAPAAAIDHLLVGEYGVSTGSQFTVPASCRSGPFRRGG